MKTVFAVWKFTRPHTLIGSAVSISSLYIILCHERLHYVHLFLIALAAGITCNVFIVGINQIADVEIDRINKPWLPIPAELLTMKQAKRIVLVCLLLSMTFALVLTPWFFGIIVLACTIGWAYSMPPFHLKRHHVPAAIAISSVRGLLVNAGAFFVFRQIVDPHAVMQLNLMLLTFFITVCGIVIAWFKDLPDVKGDAQFNIRTLAVQSSPRTSLIAGTFVMTCAYVVLLTSNAILLYSQQDHVSKILFAGHFLLLLLFMANSLFVRLRKPDSVSRFYKRFWLFFFAEYLLYTYAYW